MVAGAGAFEIAAYQSLEQFKTTVMGELFLNRNPKNARRVHLTGKNGNPIADSVDWVSAGAVTPVKDQSRCGSCWAFSTTGSLEGAYQISSGTLLSLSEEDLVQCDTTDNGCSGGLMDNAFKWVEANGIAAESAYAYTSGGGARQFCGAILRCNS